MKNRNEFVDKAAEQILSEYKNFAGPPVQVEQLAECLGIKLVSKDLEIGIDGASMVDGNQKIIVLKQDLSENRRRFTIAHELGHLMLHADHPLNVSPAQVVFYRNDESSRGTQWREIEANRFAASILMPAGVIHQLIRNSKPGLTEDGLSRLAETFKVSTEAMAFRLGNLGYTA